MPFLSEEELKKMSFKRIGCNVLISDKASIYSPETIEIGSNVRIDDFCILSGHIMLGSYIHISAYSALYGKFGIEMEDFTGLSPRCTVFSASDDFSGEYMISPMVPGKLTNVTGGKVKIKRFTQIGAGTVILPNVTLNEGTAIGAMSLIKNDIPEWEIHGGCPARFIKQRKKDILHLYGTIK
ncbi:acyltransferase [Marinilabilia rubra]|uniref:Galactoside O-acetyltransferase n=1 Tax=Marinilabilia rubra TaxID=2162893 RepID=A0A2U2B3W6_9BACT|nr:acyltransferase [Marinilabilia rubra]PWD97756.1 galactoside O-acetyltransferase [Marinilabilia rubra]